MAFAGTMTAGFAGVFGLFGLSDAARPVHRHPVAEHR
jgi:hypothetical protein